MGKRVNIEDPDEYWIECEDCGGTGMMEGPADESEVDPKSYDANGNPIFDYSAEGPCYECDGKGCIEGEADDVDE